jgi:hypothetical protein
MPNLSSNYSTTSIKNLANIYTNTNLNNNLENIYGLEGLKYRPNLGNKYGAPGVNYVKARWIYDFVKNTEGIVNKISTNNKENLINQVINTPAVIYLRINEFTQNEYGSYNFYVDQQLDPNSIQYTFLNTTYLVNENGQPISNSENSPGVDNNSIYVDNYNEFVTVLYNPVYSAFVVTLLTDSLYTQIINVTANEINNGNMYSYKLYLNFST